MEDLNSYLQEAKDSFYSELNLNEVKIGLYHGTDRYVYEMSDEKRIQYLSAIKEYLNAAKNIELDSDLASEEEKNILFGPFSAYVNGSGNYEYGNLYTTTSLNRIKDYASGANYFGEIGRMAYHVRNYVKRNGVQLDISSDVNALINELYSSIENIVPNPVYLKTYGFDKVKSNEDRTAFDKQAFLRELDFFNNNLSFLQMSFRMNDDISLKDFEEIDLFQETNLIQEVKHSLDLQLAEYQMAFLEKKIGPLDERKKMVLKMKIDSFNRQ